MQFASRDALSVVRSHLPRESADEVGEQLFSVVTLLDSERGLRRTLADSSTDPDARAELVRRLFGTQLSEPTLGVLTEVVRQRWSGARDLVDALELLGREAVLRGSQSRGELDTVEDELFRLGRIVAAHPGLERVLADRTAPAGQRTELVSGLLRGKVSPTTSTLVAQVVERLRGEPADAFDELSALAARQREESVAHVRSAVALTVEQEQRLSAALARTYGRPVTVHVEVDASITGGLVVQVGDEVVDGSVAGRLAVLRRDLGG